MRRWALEGKGIGSHASDLSDKSSTPIHLVIQPGGMSERVVLDLLTTDYVADLRAEIVKWWEDFIQLKNAESSQTSSSHCLQENPLRIITQGQELTTEYDEKTLTDMGFKDNQVSNCSKVL